MRRNDEYYAEDEYKKGHGAYFPELENYDREAPYDPYVEDENGNDWNGEDVYYTAPRDNLDEERLPPAGSSAGSNRTPNVRYLPPTGQELDRNRSSVSRGNFNDYPPAGQTDNRSRSYVRQQMPPYRGADTFDYGDREEVQYAGALSPEDELDLNRYLDYIDKYDKREISNYDMSRINREYANKPFWKVFRPSKKMIEEYGSGNESTKWPLFRYENGTWKPEVWRED